MKAALYHLVSLADRGESVDTGLDRLRRHAAARGWEVAVEAHDVLRKPGEARPGWRSLRESLAAGTASVVLCTHLHRLFTRTGDDVRLGAALVDRGVAIVAIDDHVDTTEPTQAASWRLVLGKLRQADRSRRGTAVAAGKIASALPRVEGQRKAVDSILLANYYHESMPLRAIAKRLGSSYGTVQGRLAEMRARGEIDDLKHSQSVAARGLRSAIKPAKTKV